MEFDWRLMFGMQFLFNQFKYQCTKPQIDWLVGWVCSCRDEDGRNLRNVFLDQKIGFF